MLAIWAARSLVGLTTPDGFGEGSATAFQREKTISIYIMMSFYKNVWLNFEQYCTLLMRLTS